ncbi:methyl-accepting chemotaxis protein [Sphingomonas sp.]|uniref:methyl-accepting chemotaxis protein n=1 Tax=Sphingomonas sp. TaxID=28214 RepID=UPI002E15A0BA|nr:methyl-accepting chemotaxis protein [Sphingomonas sp.]HEV7288710.1 methyl-accepting chemotaxis protein [Sphingomonas sp.]
MARKIVLSFALAIFMVCASGVVVAMSLSAMRGSTLENVNSLRVKELVSEMLASVIQQENALRGYAMLGRAELLDEYKANQDVFAKAAKEFDERVKLADQRERFAKLTAEVKDLNDRRFAELITLAANPETRARAQEISGQKQLPVVRAVVAELLTRQDEVIAERRAEQASMATIANVAVWGGAALTALVALLMGWLLARTIAAPLRDLTDATTTLAQGGEAKVPFRERADELGDIAGAVEQFRMAAVNRAEADARLAAEQQVVTTSLRNGLSALTTGDLTASIDAEFPGAYVELKTNFNAALASLRGLIGSVAESTRAIRTGSSEITQASEDLARRTEANAASLEETSAAVTQMDTRLKATAAAAGRTVERADGAIATVTSGRSVADEAVQAMTRVSDSAKGIDSVIEGLDKIAFQTRVLAMNAAVEAGRAGEAGRGFAVVADLVSALAMRAEEEAGRARDQLTATQTDIGAAVEMVQKVDAALLDISGDVSEVHTLLGDIAADNQAQSTAITQISAAIGAMDHSTQQNAAMVEQTAAAARNLTGEVSALTEQADKFEIGDSKSRRAGYTSRGRAALMAA